MGFDVRGSAVEYGFDVRDARASLHFVGVVRRRSPSPPITCRGDYIARCRAIARRRGRRDLENIRGPYRSAQISGRLIAVGFNLCPPERWVAGEIDRFLAYWELAVERPENIRSPFNRVTPDQAARAWRAGVPAFVLRLFGLQAWPSLAREGPVHRCCGAARERLRVAGRAAKWRRVRFFHLYIRPLSIKAAHALGRLCPETARVALEALAKAGQEVNRAERDARDCAILEGRDWVPWPRSPVRVRELDWAAVARAQRTLRLDASGRVRAAHAQGRRREELMAGRGIDWLCPAYPQASLEIAAAITQGKSPVEIATECCPDARFSKREAHDWVTSGERSNVIGRWFMYYMSGEKPCTLDMLEWWCKRHLPAGAPCPREWALARWLADVARRGDWGLLTRERVFVGPAGERGHACYLDRIDELVSEDLVAGPATGVERAFRRAAGRFSEEALEAARNSRRVLAPLPEGWRLFRAATHLDTPAALAREGDELGHCVGGYSKQVEQGHSVIIGLDVLGNRSTVELTRSGRVLQHRGRKNAEPHPLCQRALCVLLRRLPGNGAGSPASRSSHRGALVGRRTSEGAGRAERAGRPGCARALVRLPSAPTRRTSDALQPRDDPPAAQPQARPSLGAIFWAFLIVGATSFGGGASAHIYDAIVLRRRWLDEDRFLEAMTVGRSLPGPNVSNLAAFIGALLGGYRGAVAAVLGIVAPGVGLVLLLAASYGPLAATPGPLLRGGLQGLTAGVVGVMASTVIQALKPVARARAGLVFAGAAFVAAAVLRLSMMVVLVTLVPLASLLNRDEAP